MDQHPEQAVTLTLRLAAQVMLVTDDWELMFELVDRQRCGWFEQTSGHCWIATDQQNRQWSIDIVIK